MKLILLLALAQTAPAPQAPSPSPAAPAEASAPAIEPWTGSLAQGLAEMQRLAESGKTDEALALTERLLAPTRSALWREKATERAGWKRDAVEAAGPILDAFGLASLSDAERATIQHARGVLLAESKEPQHLAAVEAFDRARALAGPGDLRLDSTYDAAWAWLAEGEALRAKIPEVSGAAPTPAPAAPAGPAGAGPPEPDPLQLARAAYQQARGRFVDRVRLEPADADTRANLELAQRRLRELKEIEKKREEEKKKQEQQQKDEQSKNDQDQQKDSKKDEKPKDDDKKDSQDKPDEKPKPDEKKPDEKQPKEPQEQPKDASESKDQKKDANPKPSKEELLTREEVMRLLDILKNREDEGKKLQEQLRAARRVSVKKDW